MTTNRPVEIPYPENDEDTGYRVRKCLEVAGLTDRITHVIDGRLTVDFVNRQGEFDGWEVTGPLVMILDVDMPRIDGIEVLPDVRADAALADLPIVLLTTSENSREIERCFAEGCDAYVVKPFDFLEFAETVKHLGLFLQVMRIPHQDQGDGA